VRVVDSGGRDRRLDDPCGRRRRRRHRRHGVDVERTVALPRARFGYKMGDATLIDLMIWDGLRSDVRRAAHGAAGRARRPRARRLHGGTRTPGPCARTSGRRRPRTQDSSTTRSSRSARSRRTRASAATRRSKSSRRSGPPWIPRGRSPPATHRVSTTVRSARRLLRGVREAPRPGAARNGGRTGLRRRRVRVARAHAGKRRRAGAGKGGQVDRRRAAGRGERGVLVGWR